MGFTRTAAAEVPLHQLQSLDDLLVYLHQIQKLEPAKQASASVNLSQWVQGIFSGGWQAIDEVLWAEASTWRIPRECLDTYLVWHLKEKDALHYLQQSGIEEAKLCESLVAYACLESEQVHP